ncbi:MepB family protein [Paeniglutamicibacter sp. NPDC012692]|uniref:MepB family protein n=1 Tax=Paeniglutamicibacter sp. NPDC012692 TaxID=3364388 RepID=UPI00369CB464
MPHRTQPAPLVPPELARLLAHAPLPPGHGITGYFPDPNPEARAYSGCGFVLNRAPAADIHVVFRSAKVTPTKAGLFVTLWQRDAEGETRPYTSDDGVDEFWIFAETKHGSGCFKFPARELAKYGVLTTAEKPGKRGFRLYTPWDTDLNAGATKAWAWQRGFFTVLSR